VRRGVQGKLPQQGQGGASAKIEFGAFCLKIWHLPTKCEA